jgi:hypothetical protein
VSKTAKQVLNEAANHIERNGKAKGSFAATAQDTPGAISFPDIADVWKRSKMCALGAISYAAGGNPNGTFPVPPEERQALRALGNTPRAGAFGSTLVGIDELGIADWSDSSDAETVVAILREVAATL